MDCPLCSAEVLSVSKIADSMWMYGPCGDFTSDPNAFADFAKSHGVTV